MSGEHASVGGTQRRCRRGWARALVVLASVLAFAAILAVSIYLIADSRGMAERSIERAEASHQHFDAYLRGPASSGGAAADIDKAKQLLDSGAITQGELDAIKAKALA